MMSMINSAKSTATSRDGGCYRDSGHCAAGHAQVRQGPAVIGVIGRGARDLSTSLSQNAFSKRAPQSRRHPEQPDAVDGFQLPSEFGEPTLDHIDFIEHLTADVPEHSRTVAGREVCNWTKRPGRDNEFRDVARYNWALAWHYTHNGKLWHALPARVDPNAPPKKPPPATPKPGFVRTFNIRGQS
jgi:hypothetical protein